jgi:hypothetical protein
MAIQKTDKKKKAAAKAAKKAKPAKKASTKKKAAAEPAKKSTSKKKAAAKPVKKVSTKKKAVARPAKKATAKKATDKKNAAAKPTKKPGTGKKPSKKKYALADKVMRPADVAWRMIDGEAVIVTPSDSMMHSLNEVGTRIWELMDGSRSIRDIATTLEAEFQVDGQRVEADALWFVDCLAKKGLVTSP